ncbi:MAG: PIN domain-containing protein [Kiritimatiellae bacterium]|nr:PIN domain-containing protein [Kiritimatiellia bacterium]
MSCFVDTSALLAVLDRDDDNHAKAKRGWQRLLAAKEPLVTTSYVLVETFAILQHRIGLAAARTLNDDIYPILTVDWIGQTLHEKGAGSVLASGRRKLSLVDCVSFDVMRQRGLRRVFAFDKHFSEQGFASVP